MADKPTSKFKVFCDTFSNELELRIHKTDKGEQKLLIQARNEQGDTIELSLYGEDAYLLQSFISTAGVYLADTPETIDQKIEK